MGPPAGRKTDRRHKQGEESRRAILEATLDLAAERGYDGTTVALVTERTGLPASSVYWHFGSKDGLLAAALEFGYERWRAHATPWSGGTLEGHLGAAVAAMTQDPRFWRVGLLLALQPRVEEPAARRIFVDVRRRSEAGVRDWWAAQLPEGSPLPERLALLITMMIEGLFVHLASGGAADVQRLTGLFADSLMRELDPPHGTTRSARASAGTPT